MGVDIQGKLRLAIGSVKDHASIGKAMIYNHDGKGFSAIEIAVLRATGHDNGPIEDKYMHEILFLVSNSPGSIPFLAERISRRLCKTRDRLVALKTLSLIHRLLRGGNRSFEQELRSAHLSGHLQMSTHCLRKNSDSCFSFLHSYAAYLEERVRWAINQAGKLEPVMFNGLEFGCYMEKSVDMVFRKLPKCQAFIDRVLDCSPRDILPADNLAQAAMGNTLKESFQVYSMFCEGIEILVNMFFDLTRPARTLACDILKRASRQSKELHGLYDTCKQIIVNKNLEYPSEQIITMDHVLALERCSKFISTNSSSIMCNTGTLTPPPLSDCLTPMGKESQKEGNGDITSSSTPFSCNLETKISMVWVVFEDNYGELEVPLDIV
ncbi:hypothetical protein PTKIN_Ptkin07bG0000200 [Pterospermum kingtungense]